MLRKGWEAYDRLSLEDKVSVVGTDNYRIKLHDAKDSVILVVDWGLDDEIFT